MGRSRGGLGLTACLLELGIHHFGELGGLVIIVLPLLDLTSSTIQLGFLCQRVIALRCRKSQRLQDNILVSQLHRIGLGKM